MTRDMHTLLRSAHTVIMLYLHICYCDREQSLQTLYTCSQFIITLSYVQQQLFTSYHNIHKYKLWNANSITAPL